MGIEIPPPKGGPAVFTSSSPGNESPVALSPDEDRLRTPELGDDLNDEGSLCLSEGEAADSAVRAVRPCKLRTSEFMLCFQT